MGYADIGIKQAFATVRATVDQVAETEAELENAVEAAGHNLVDVADDIHDNASDAIVAMIKDGLDILENRAVKLGEKLP